MFDNNKHSDQCNIHTNYNFSVHQQAQNHHNVAYQNIYRIMFNIYVYIWEIHRLIVWFL